MSLVEETLPVDPASIRWVGKKLHRTECLLATAGESLFTGMTPNEKHFRSRRRRCVPC